MHYIYDTRIRDHSRPMKESERLRNLTIIASLASFTATIASCTLTHPLDLIRTRVYF